MPLLLAFLFSSALSEVEPVPPPPLPTSCEEPSPWPLWEQYARAFLSDDGRIIDRTDRDKSTSEGQGYALFFSLVANDRERFRRILEWTSKNLAGGSLEDRLPAWKWGRDGDGKWKVLDANAASDADLWIAYSLLEAARLWKAPRHDETARRILRNVLAHEVVEAKGLGRVLLPGPQGFLLDEERVRLNPSYLAPQLMRRFAAAGVEGPWKELEQTSLRILREGAPGGLQHDWLIWDPAQGFGIDPISGSVGSYDAIRVYLWVAMLPKEDPDREALLRSTGGLWSHWKVRGTLPERVDPRSDLPGRGRGPPGFVAVLIAQALAREDREAARALESLLAETWAEGLYGRPPAYYDQNLILFARGYVEGRYGFGAGGSLETRWEGACIP